MDKPDARYDIETATLYPPMTHLDLKAIAGAETPWWNRTLSEVNDAVVRMAVMEGDFHWHKHDREDEFFFVLEGRLDIELEDRMVSLAPSQGFTVPRGVMHFPHARGRTALCPHTPMPAHPSARTPLCPRTSLPASPSPNRSTPVVMTINLPLTS